MTDWENQETDRKYNDSLILKLFCFQFVNSYASLLYIAFVKDSTIQRCDHINCMGELQVQLVSIYFTNLFLNIIELGFPLLFGFYRLKREHIRAKRFGKELSLEEKESVKPEFDTTIENNHRLWLYGAFWHGFSFHTFICISPCNNRSKS